MIDEEKSLVALCKFLLWIFTALFISFIGLSGVCAETVDVGYVTNKTTVLIDAPASSSGAAITLPAGTRNTYGNIYQIWFLLNNVEIKKGFTYYLEIYTPTQNIVNVNELHVLGANSQICQDIGISDTTLGYAKLWFSCPANTDNLTFGISNNSGQLIARNDWYWSYTYLRYFTDDDDIDLGPVISNATNNTNNIINNNNQNTQDIINNNNQNTQDIINSNQVCEDVDASDKEYDGYLYDNGQIGTNLQNQIVTKYFSIDQDTKITKLENTLTDAAYRICFYDNNKTFISCLTRQQYYELNEIPIPNNANYVRFTINSSSNVPKFKICKNGNQALNDSINGLDNTLNNDNVDENGIASAFDSFNNYLDDNSTITQLLTLPVTLYTAILNNLNGICSPFNLGQLYGTDLILPCINISQYLGNSLWTMIDIIISGFAIYAIAKKMIKVFNNFSSLREGDVIDD